MVANQPAASSCTIDPQRIGQIEVLSVAGVVDMLTAAQLEEAIGTAAKESPRGVVVDLTAVDFLASAGMGILVATQLPAFVHFPAHADPATLDPKIPANLALVYFPVTFTLYAVALGCLAYYRISRASHEENLRQLAAEAEQTGFTAGLEGVRTGEPIDRAEQAAG